MSSAVQPAAFASEVAQARTAAAWARLQATIAALATSSARIHACNLAAAAAKPPKPLKSASPLALLVWAAHQPK